MKTLTDKERDLLGNILACHIDLTLTPAMNQAVKYNNTNRVIELTNSIKFEQELLNKIIWTKHKRDILNEYLFF